MSYPQVDPVTAAVWQLACRLQSVSHESRAVTAAAGRVLARPLIADRDSPPLNVSAMDGYAFRLSDIGHSSGTLPVTATATAGRPAPALLPSSAIRIFTGAPVPTEADCVVAREQTREESDRFWLDVDVSQLKTGQHIRYRGENGQAGCEVLHGGTLITSSAMAAAASVAVGHVDLYRPVRVAIVNTGDELVEAGHSAADWQIRDSNGPTLEALLSQHRWIELVGRQRAADDLSTVTQVLRASLEQADAVLLTGGVSMGDTDHVPAAIEAIGGETIFHRLPIRPGKPVLGAVTGAGKLIVGLPGNPVSVSVTASVIALPLLRQLGGFAELMPASPQVLLSNPDTKPLALTWYRLVTLDRDGMACLLDNRGSGDLISLGRSHGFVAVPAQATGPGPWPLTLW